MLVRIEDLIQQVYIEQKNKRMAELKVLQEQIKPHFLYNTLDTISWMARDYGAGDVVRLVDALTNMFRIGLSRGRDYISVEQELSYVANYLYIQKIRYGGKLNYQIVKDEEILNEEVPKLMLQPLVENAIYHGMEFMDGDGEITLKVWKEGEDLYFTVRDNGLGMTREQVESLFSDSILVTSKKGSGIGVKNVNERIKLYFGEEYGLRIDSEPDEGTEITIHLPAVPYSRLLAEGGER